MGIIDFVIVAGVLLALALCVRSFVSGRGDCHDCGSSGGCGSHGGGKSGCSAAKSMLTDVERALAAERDE
ncbi:hypothetical protein [Olsenella urininfantis]|uniref:hypothetical protein n=1 Tax=Olsenella urininfantis TaxID=1871033 RepID=UPI000984B89C|nr:hypothetical protein [Olsenella urininfantis]